MQVSATWTQLIHCPRGLPFHQYKNKILFLVPNILLFVIYPITLQWPLKHTKGI